MFHRMRHLKRSLMRSATSTSLPRRPTLVTTEGHQETYRHRFFQVCSVQFLCCAIPCPCAPHIDAPFSAAGARITSRFGRTVDADMIGSLFAFPLRSGAINNEQVTHPLSYDLPLCRRHSPTGAASLSTGSPKPAGAGSATSAEPIRYP